MVRERAGAHMPATYAWSRFAAAGLCVPCDLSFQFNSLRPATSNHAFLTHIRGALCGVLFWDVGEGGGTQRRAVKLTPLLPVYRGPGNHFNK